MPSYPARRPARVGVNTPAFDHDYCADWLSCDEVNAELSEKVHPFCSPGAGKTVRLCPQVSTALGEFKVRGFLLGTAWVWTCPRVDRLRDGKDAKVALRKVAKAPLSTHVPGSFAERSWWWGGTQTRLIKRARLVRRTVRQTAPPSRSAL